MYFSGHIVLQQAFNGVVLADTILMYMSKKTGKGANWTTELLTQATRVCIYPFIILLTIF